MKLVFLECIGEAPLNKIYVKKKMDVGLIFRKDVSMALGHVLGGPSWYIALSSNCPLYLVFLFNCFGFGF